jgi:hypothetical protein
MNNKSKYDETEELIRSIEEGYETMTNLTILLCMIIGGLSVGIFYILWDILH